MFNIITRKYTKLKIRNKFFVIVVTLLLISSIVTVTAIQISYKIYDGVIMEQSSQILNSYTNAVDKELNKIERLTFDILSNKSNQVYFKKIKSEFYNYEDYQMINEISNRFITLSNSENYIYSIGFLDQTGKEYSIGRYVKYLDKPRIQEVMLKANQNKGAITWISPSEYDNCIIAAREIKSVEDMSTLVTLIIRIDIDKLSRAQIRDSKYKSNLIILDGEKVVLDKYNFLKAYKIHNQSHDTVKKIVEIGGQKNIISYTTSSYTNWIYVNILPYHNIFSKVIQMKIIIWLVLLGIFILVIFCGFKFSKDITEPIVNLSEKMKRVEKGDFHVDETELTKDLYNQDEICQLNNEFAIMLNEINHLIEENYIKQLIIKDSEFKLLQTQINPHFLYNTLASINGLAKINKQDKIVAMVKALSKLLRNSINNKESLISINEEIDLLNNYIYIQQMRFGERLQVYLEVEEKVKPYKILKLTIQPFVENAISYGLENLEKNCEIYIKAIAGADNIKILIEDNGPGIAEDILEKINLGLIKPKGNGIGLKNIQERLRIIFEEKGTVEIENRVTGGTRVIVRLPYRME